MDGHSERAGELVSIENNCDEIENYIMDNLSGNLYCLSGFSMGATMAAILPLGSDQVCVCGGLTCKGNPCYPKIQPVNPFHIPI